MLPVDLCAPFESLHEAAVAADAAFDGAGVDYLVHNAGAPHPCRARHAGMP